MVMFVEVAIAWSWLMESFFWVKDQGREGEERRSAKGARDERLDSSPEFLPSPSRFFFLPLLLEGDRGELEALFFVHGMEKMFHL